MGGQPILERERELVELAAAADEAKRGQGSIVASASPAW
jgi:hypothetical protein